MFVPDLDALSPRKNGRCALLNKKVAPRRRKAAMNRTHSILGQDRIKHRAGNVGQAKIAAGVAVGETLVVDAHEM